MNPVIRKLHEAQLRKDLPEFRPGDTVRVNVRLLEGEGGFGVAIGAGGSKDQDVRIGHQRN